MSFVIVGWSAFAYLCWKVAGAKMENQVYNPFDILGISAGLSEKEIKSHFKKLSKL
jgi:translocation protein SEC63